MSNFYDLWQLMETYFNFGKWIDHDTTEADSGWMNWALQNVQWLSPELKKEIETELLARQQGKQRAKMPSESELARRRAMRTGEKIEVPPEKIWTKAKVIGKNKNRLEIGKEIALSKNSEGNWDFITLDDRQRKGTISNENIAKVVESIKNASGKPVQSTEIEKLMPEVLPDVEVKEKPKAEKKSSGAMPDHMLSDEQKAIDAKFKAIIESPYQTHISIQARAGTGKTTLLKHLAWKYGNPRQKWLYLVFNTKNKVEAEEKFPDWVQVETTNGFLGKVLNSIPNKSRMLQTDKVVDIGKLQGNKKNIDKAKLLMDGPAFNKLMLQLGLKDKSVLNSRYDLGKEAKTLGSLLTSIQFEFKKQVTTLLGLAKSYALDPRQPDIKTRILEILGRYDFDTELSEVKERINRYGGGGFQGTIIAELNQILGYSFMQKDYKEEIIKATEFMLRETMPHATNQVYSLGSTNYQLGQYRDFVDDLWYASVFANDLVWPKYDIVLADEVQDFNANQHRTLQKLHEAGAKIVAVGDEFQCVIENTKISVKNGDKLVQDIKPEDLINTCYGGGKYKEAKVTDIFMKEVNNIPVVKVTTRTGLELTTTTDHIHFAGYTTKDCDKIHFVYLMYKEVLGYRIGITNSKRGFNGFGANKRLNQERADKMWLLGAFDNKTDAQYYEQYYSIKYGLPTWTFVEVSGCNVTQEVICKLFSVIDTTAGAQKLLEDKHMDIRYPHVFPRCTSRKRYRNFNIILCGDCRQGGLHSYSIAGSDPTDAITIMDSFNVRKAKRGWRAASSNQSMNEIHRKANKAHNLINAQIIEKARLNNVALPFTPASHILPGMTIYILKDNEIIYDKVDFVSVFKYTGKVYDLNVERYHNFIANNIPTHNSIYRFVGADAQAFQNLSKTLGELSHDRKNWTPYTLSKNFRSRQAIIDFANEYTHVNDLKRGKEFKDGGLGEVSYHDMKYDDAFDLLQKEKIGGKIKQTAFIARTNAPLAHVALRLLTNGIPFVIVGKDISEELLGHIKTITRIGKLEEDDDVDYLVQKLNEHLEQEKERYEGQIAKKAHLQELTETTEALIALISRFNPENQSRSYIKNTSIRHFKAWLSANLNGLNVSSNEKDLKEYKEKLEQENPVILTTSHKSKGLQFTRVILLRDDLFPHPRAKREEDLAQEANNYYVAITRAMDELFILDPKGQPGYKEQNG